MRRGRYKQALQRPGALTAALNYYRSLIDRETRCLLYFDDIFNCALHRRLCFLKMVMPLWTSGLSLRSLGQQLPAQTGRGTSVPYKLLSNRKRA